MRASLQNKPTFFRFKLHLHIQFSEEEKAIIRTRALQNYIFDISPGYIGVFSSEASYSLAVASFAIFAAGIGLSFIGIISPAIGTIALIGIFGGPVLFISALITGVSHRNITDKKLTLGYLLDHPNLIISTLDPVQIPTAEQNILARLSDLKVFLTQTHQLVTRRTIDL